MRMPCELQARSVYSVPSCEVKRKKDASFGNNEPISDLDTRSPSPSTSTSTLSSFGGKSGYGGGDGSTDNIPSLAAVSDCTIQQDCHGTLPPLPSDILASMGTAAAGAACLKEEWAAELQPIPAGFEVAPAGYERIGLELEDWESLLSESAGEAAPDQTLLRWISGDLGGDSSLSLKQFLQGGNANEISGNTAFGANNQNKGFDSLVAGCTADVTIVTSPSSCLVASDSGVSLSHGSKKFGASDSPTCLNDGMVSQKQSFPSGVASLSNRLPGEASAPKTQAFSPQVMANQPQFQSVENSCIFSTLSSGPRQQQHQFQPQPKRHSPYVDSSNAKVPKVQFPEQGHDFMLRKQVELPQLQPSQLDLSQQFSLLHSHHLQQKPLVVPKQELLASDEEKIGVQNHQLRQQQQRQLLYGQLCELAELIMARNFSHAQGILARLNHQLSSIVKPYQRAAFYFKEALHFLLILMPNPSTSPYLRIPTPFDGMFKMGAYKVLSEVSPLIQFMNFTSNQALLEALGNARNIHIVDFDIGFGAQWSSFMQELQRKNGGSPSLKITAFATPSTHHHVEITLMHENLSQFASDIGVSFQLEVVNFDSFDPNSYSMTPSSSPENEVVVVNFPLWSTFSHLSAVPSILRFIRQLSPKIVVSLDIGCEMIELPFPNHLHHALQYYEALFDSIDAANVTLDTATKIERFLFQPRIESIVLGCLHSADRMPSIRSLFASNGFLPVAFSNFAQAQAEFLVNKTDVRGFRLEKWQESLVLCWKQRKLVAVSTWRC